VKRNLLVIALGLLFLAALTWLGTLLTNITPSQPTPQVQTASAGPYQVTLQVSPDPPLTTQPATLSLQIVEGTTGAVVSDAHVFLQGAMETMDMGTAQVEARYAGDGTYRASVQFSMSGPWQLQIVIRRQGVPAVSAQFDITAQ
jgi:hypothetical protein